MGSGVIGFVRQAPCLLGTEHLEDFSDLLSLPCLQKQQSVLMSVIAGEAVASLRTLEDKQVLQQCMATLRELFKEQVRGLGREGGACCSLR